MKKAQCYITLLSAFALLSCGEKIDYEYIKSKEIWIYHTGYRGNLGDIISFRRINDDVLKHDTIFNMGKPVGLIISLNKKKNELHVKSLTSDSVGIFINSEEYEK